MESHSYVRLLNYQKVSINYETGTRWERFAYRYDVYSINQFAYVSSPVHVGIVYLPW